MIQKVLTKYALVLHIAFIVLFPVLFVTPANVFGLAPLLWLALIALELMVLLPSVRKGETLADARQRVVRALVGDAFLYIGVVIVGLVLMQWCNSGCKLVYLSDADVWQFSSPPVAWVPFSVAKRAAGSYVAVFFACVVMGLALRTAVSKGAKRLLLQGLAGSSGVVALYSVLQACQGVEPYAAKSLLPGAVAMGSFFGFWLLMGMGVFVDALAQYQRGTVPLFLLGVVGNLLGVLYFANALALSVYGVLAVLLFVYWIVYLNPHVAKHVQFKLFVVSILTAAALVGLLVYVFPGNPVVAKIKAAIPVTEYWNTLSALKNMRTAAALGIWQAHPWMGVGADGFRHFAGLAIAGKDWGLMKADPACVYNDCLQFLCEFGVLGSGILLAAVLALMIPICYRARIAWGYIAHDGNEGRHFLMRISPIVLTGALATFVCFLESWIANPFRFPSLLLSWVCVMAVLPAFLPTRAMPAAPQI